MRFGYLLVMCACAVVATEGGMRKFGNHPFAPGTVAAQEEKTGASPLTFEQLLKRKQVNRSYRQYALVDVCFAAGFAIPSHAPETTGDDCAQGAPQKHYASTEGVLRVLF